MIHVAVFQLHKHAERSHTVLTAVNGGNARKLVDSRFTSAPPFSTWRLKTSATNQLGQFISLSFKRLIRRLRGCYTWFNSGVKAGRQASKQQAHQTSDKRVAVGKNC
ncbi:MAG: hypothetical protein WKF30_14230 [Pyrinomonadaceae bacterium]